MGPLTPRATTKRKRSSRKSTTSSETKRTAQKRYEEVLALRERYVLYLAVFEKLYRFTPFSADAQPRIRDKCPLELAGYDIRQVPMASLCAGLSVAWPLEVAQDYVPNS